MSEAYLAHITEDGTKEQTVLEHLQNTAELSGRFARTEPFTVGANGSLPELPGEKLFE